MCECISFITIHTMLPTRLELFLWTKKDTPLMMYSQNKWLYSMNNILIMCVCMYRKTLIKVAYSRKSLVLEGNILLYFVRWTW